MFFPFSIYKQYPIMTKQKTFFLTFLQMYIKTHGNVPFTEVFGPFTQYFVEAALAAITASSLLGCDATSLAHLYLGMFSCSSLHILSSSVRLAAQLFSGLSIDVRSGSSPGPSWATQGHSETCPEASVVLAVCLELLSCWKVNLCPSLRC